MPLARQDAEKENIKIYFDTKIVRIELVYRPAGFYAHGNESQSCVT